MSVLELKKCGECGAHLADDDSRLSISFTYTNYRGETSERHVVPHTIYFGSTEYHKVPQWLLTGYDLDKHAVRIFALGDCNFTALLQKSLPPTLTVDLARHLQNFVNGVDSKQLTVPAADEAVGNLMHNAKIALEIFADLESFDFPDLEEVWAQAAYNHANFSEQGSREQDLSFFGLALAGEAGELANFIKKRLRDGDEHEQEIRWEIADVFAYTVLAAQNREMSAAELLHNVLSKQQAFVAKQRAKRNPGAGGGS